MFWYINLVIININTISTNLDENSPGILHGEQIEGQHKARCESKYQSGFASPPPTTYHDKF